MFLFFRQFYIKTRFSMHKFPIYSFFRLSNQNSPFTATYGQISIGLFLFKSHYFRTYLLDMIFLDPSTTSLRPPAQNLGVVTPQPPVLMPMLPMTRYYTHSCRISSHRIVNN